MDEKLKIFKEKFNNELKDIDNTTIYQDIDILEGIPEYMILSDEIEKNPKFQSTFEKIEKEVLKKNKMIKIKGDDNTYYLSIGEVYDLEGNLIINECLEECYDEDDLFCEYNGDNIYKLMEKNILRKIEKIKKQNEDSLYDF